MSIYFQKKLAFNSFMFYIMFVVRDVAQPGSAFAWGASGRWFESSHPDHKLPLANASGITCSELRSPCPKASQA